MSSPSAATPVLAEMPYSLGCPVWACEHWRGSLFTSKAKREDWLAQYSTVFNAVEGNSTFYALPSLETADRWAKSTHPGFEFCLKVPRAITHDKRLLSADAETRAFQRVLEILADGERLGPSFLQLPPTFDRQGLRPLQSFLNRWPSDFPLAVEVRHQDWFDNGPIEEELDETLRNCGVDRVIFDSRALYATPPQTPAEEVSQTRKPRIPLRHTVTGKRPFVRVIGRDDVNLVTPWIEEWAGKTAQWIQNGLRPLMFTHAPDDTFAPEFARAFHKALQASEPGVDDLAGFPGESEPSNSEQMQLF